MYEDYIIHVQITMYEDLKNVGFISLFSMLLTDSGHTYCVCVCVCRCLVYMDEYLR